MEQQQELLDFGDAPDSPVAVGYPTLLINNGARHGLGMPTLGPNPGGLKDPEADGQPTANADGDDLNPAGADDEDGVAFQAGPLIPGQPGTVTVSLVGPFAGAFLSAWVDFNGDSSWAQLGDQIFVAQPLNPGPNILAFPVPATAKPNITTYARFRVHTNPGGVAYTGFLPYGEVEDYTVKIGQEMQHEFEFGDAPEGALAYPPAGIMGMFPTCITVLPATWIQHTNFGAWLGPAFDLEADGNAGLCPVFSPYDADECFADGDAGLMFPPSYTINAGNNVVLCPNAPVGPPLGQRCAQAVWGANIDVDVHNHMPNQTVGFLNVLIDWDQNGQWGGASQCPGGLLAPEHVLVDFPIPNPFDGPLSLLGPPSFLIGPNICHVWMRVAITERPVGLSQMWDGSGSFEDGETEDYLINAGPPLAIVSAVSRKKHGTAGSFDQPSGSVEGRANGPTQIVTTFNQPIQRLFLPTGDVTVSSGIVGAITIGVPPNDNVLTVDVTGVADQAIFRIGYPGIASACDATQTTAASKCWYVLIGDVNGNRVVNNTDIVQVRGQLGQPVTVLNFTKDVNANGVINNTDIVLVRGKLGNTVSGICNP